MRMFEDPVKLINFEVVLPSQAPAGEDTLVNPASNTHEPSEESEIEGPAATALFKLNSGKAIGIAWNKVNNSVNEIKTLTTRERDFACVLTKTLRPNIANPNQSPVRRHSDSGSGYGPRSL